MHNARTILGRDKISFINFVPRLRLIQRHVVLPNRRKISNALPGIVENISRTSISDDNSFTIFFIFSIHNTLPYRQRDIAGKRPRSRRPSKKECTRLINQFEFRRNRKILHVLIPLRELVRRERRPAARTPRHDLIILVQPPVLRSLREEMPEHFHVRTVEGEVCLRLIDPIADAFGELGPQLDIREHTFAALLIKGSDTILLDIGLARETELLLNLKLDRETVRIPTSAPIHPVATHRLVARNRILESASFEMVNSWLAVGGWRTLGKNKIALGRFLFKRLLEYALLLPKGKYRLFALCRFRLQERVSHNHLI